MRNWIIGPVLGGLLVASWSTLSWCGGQPAPAIPGAAPQFPIKPPAGATGGAAPTKLTAAQQLLHASAGEGKDWLLRMNRPNGRFLYGFIPCLRVPIAEDNFAHQSAAAFALARAARTFKEDQAAAVARQALLTLLLETEKDAKDEKVRIPQAPGNPIESASWLVLAIHELPAPGADLLQRSDELCEYLRRCQQKDGTFAAPASSEAKPAAKDKNLTATGLAMYALTRSLQQRQEPWRVEAVRKGRDACVPAWRADKSLEALPWLSSACAEAFLLTKEKAFADSVNELNDWLCTLQYKELQPHRPLWLGGFKKWEQGQVQLVAPNIHDAVFMEALGQGCRVAKENGDLQRFQSYRHALELTGQFLLTLQYTPTNTQHFELKYRHDFLLGGFHASHQDGLLRIDFTQQAVCGLMKYLTEVAAVQ